MASPRHGARKDAAAGGLASDEQYSRVYDELNRQSHSSDELDIKSRVENWWSGAQARFQVKRNTYGPLDWLAVFLPAVGWLRRYNIREYFLGDLIAGLSVGFMVVPQGMSYALLAGLPAVWGLYGAFVPVLIYSVFGSSPQLAVGPVAVTSLLLGTGLGDMFPESDAISDPSKPKTDALKDVQEQYNHAATQVALLVAIMYTAIGIFRLGFLARFLSHSVISGFTTGAAIIIGLSQLKYFFGVKTPNTSTGIEAIRELSKVVEDTQWREAVMFTVWLTMLLSMKFASKKYTKLRWMRPIGPITVVILAISIIKIFNLYDGRIKIIAKIPSGLPPVTIKEWGPLFRGETQFGKQIKLAVVVMLVDFMESISIAKALARKGKYNIAVTQEIVGMGIANFFGAMFSAYTTTGSFSRSAVSADVGSKTGLFGIIQATVIMFVLLFLTPVFKYTPYNAIGAIIISGLVGLVDLSGAKFLWKANKLDFLVWLAAFIGTVLAGVEIGLAIAIGLALMLVIYQSAFPHTAYLGRLPGTEVYRSTAQYPAAQEVAGVAIVRVDAPIYFANVQTVIARVEKYLARAKANLELGPIKFLVLDLSPVAFIDATGMHNLVELVGDLKAEGIQAVLANPCNRVKLQLEKVHLLDDIGKNWVFVRTADAVNACSKALLNLKLDDKSRSVDGLWNNADTVAGGVVKGK